MANYRYKTSEIEAMKKNILTHMEHEAETKTAWRLRCAIEGQLMCCCPSKREDARLRRELALYEKLTKNDLPNWQSEPTQATTSAEIPQISTKTPQTTECIGESGYRVCSHCGKRFHEGYFLGDEYACSHECAVALYGGDEDQLAADLEEEEREPGTTECYWSIW